MTSLYSKQNNITINNYIGNKETRKAFAWGIVGYRPDVSSFYNHVQKLATTLFLPTVQRLYKTPTIIHTVSSEARLIALYCCDSEYLMKKTELLRKKIRTICEHFGSSITERNRFKPFQNDKIQSALLEVQNNESYD